MRLRTTSRRWSYIVPVKDSAHFHAHFCVLYPDGRFERLVRMVILHRRPTPRHESNLRIPARGRRMKHRIRLTLPICFAVFMAFTQRSPSQICYRPRWDQWHDTPFLQYSVFVCMRSKESCLELFRHCMWTVGHV